MATKSTGAVRGKLQPGAGRRIVEDSRPNERRQLAGRKRQPISKDALRKPAGKFGARLEKLVGEADLTVKEFADRIGKGEDSVWAYFKGKAVPHINDWPKIAAALGLNDARELLPELPAKGKTKSAG